MYNSSCHFRSPLTGSLQGHYLRIDIAANMGRPLSILRSGAQSDCSRNINTVPSAVSRRPVCAEPSWLLNDADSYRAVQDQPTG